MVLVEFTVLFGERLGRLFLGHLAALKWCVAFAAARNLSWQIHPPNMIIHPHIDSFIHSSPTASSNPQMPANLLIHSFWMRDQAEAIRCCRSIIRKHSQISSGFTLHLPGLPSTATSLQEAPCHSRGFIDQYPTSTLNISQLARQFHLRSS